MIATKPQSPYKGLVPFEDSELDALLFFGREREGQIISANVLAARLTVLYGPSGVGKTSVLRAGVAYRLRQMAQGNVQQRGHPEFVVVVFDAWSSDPVTGLRDAAHEALAAQFGSALLDAREGESLADTLGRWTDALACDLLFVLDQAEEYFLYHADESEFADELPELVTRPGLRVPGSTSRFGTTPSPSSIGSRDGSRTSLPTTSGSIIWIAAPRAMRSSSRSSGSTILVRATRWRSSRPSSERSSARPRPARSISVTPGAGWPPASLTRVGSRRRTSSS